MITWFDITQLYILQSKTFAVSEPGVFELGELWLNGWYTHFHGHFFYDMNENGIKDEDEPGIAHGPFPVLRLRDGTQIDRGFQFEVPFDDPERLGYYSFHQTYPLTSWISMHAYHPLWEMTGL